MRLTFILNAPAQLESGVVLLALPVLRDFLVLSSLQEGFPQVDDWLDVQ